MFLDTNYEIVTLPEDEAEQVKKHFAYYKNGACKVIPGNLLSSLALKETVLPQIHNMKFGSSDVFVCSFSRSGSTWTQEIVWAMTHNTNLDHQLNEGHTNEKALHLDLDATLGVYGFPKILQSLLQKHQASTLLDLIDKAETPRVLKTHLFIDLLPKSAQEKSKFIYVIRSPLSTCMSLYHYSKDMKFLNFKGNLDEFIDCFIEGNIHYGSWLEYIKCWHRLRHRPNVLTIFYEELRKDPRGHIHKLNTFLETNLTEKQIDNVLHYCSFQEMIRRDPLHHATDVKSEVLNSSSSSGLLRKGNDTSVAELTDEQKSKLKKYFRENLENVELPYDFSEFTEICEMVSEI